MQPLINRAQIPSNFAYTPTIPDYKQMFLEIFYNPFEGHDPFCPSRVLKKIYLKTLREYEQNPKIETLAQQIKTLANILLKLETFEHQLNLEDTLATPLAKRLLAISLDDLKQAPFVSRNDLEYKSLMAWSFSMKKFKGDDVKIQNFWQDISHRIAQLETHPRPSATFEAWATLNLPTEDQVN